MEKVIHDFNININDAGDQRPENLPTTSKSLVGSLLAKYVKNSKPVTSLQEELNRFSTVNCNEEDIMEFWKSNEKDYPKLAKIARVLLGIPMTSSKSEGAFSTTGCLMRKDRASLTLYRIERTLFVHDNYDLLKM